MAVFLKPFVVLGTQSLIALERIFSALLQPRLPVISLYESLTQLSVMPPTFSKNRCPAFSVIEAAFLCYFSSHFAAGSPLKAQDTSHLLSASDIPCSALCADRSRVCWPRPPRESSHNQGRQEAWLIVGEKYPHFDRGSGSRNLTVATGPSNKVLSAIGGKVVCRSFASLAVEQLVKGCRESEAMVSERNSYGVWK